VRPKIRRPGNSAQHQQKAQKRLLFASVRDPADKLGREVVANLMLRARMEKFN